MRFLFKNKKNLLNLVIPAQIHGLVEAFHQSIIEYHEGITCTEQTPGSFEYRFFKKKATNINPSVIYARLAHPSLDKTTISSRFFGPKGLEILVTFSADNNQEARALADDFLMKLSLYEMEEEEERKVTGYVTVFEWYQTTYQRWHGIHEGNIADLVNDALKDKRL